MSDDEARRQSFGSAVEAYDRTRPDYPVAAVEWCLGEPESRLQVVDLGAGTGKLTRILLSLGHEVTAVEPDERMLGRLQDVLQGDERLRTASGNAEAIPVVDGGADAVIAGQAWHWFDQDLASNEIARVLRPGGRVAAIWYAYDRRVDWLDRWAKIVRMDEKPTGRAAMATDVPQFGEAFTALEQAVFSYSQTLAPADLVERAATVSAVNALAPHERQATLEAVEELVATHPDLQVTEVELPYRIECFGAFAVQSAERS